MAACCQEPSNENFTVTGELVNVDDGYQMLLFKRLMSQKVCP